MVSECFCSWLSELSVQFTSKVLDFGMLQGSRQCPRHHSCTTYLYLLNHSYEIHVHLV